VLHKAQERASQSARVVPRGPERQNKRGGERSAPPALAQTTTATPAVPAGPPPLDAQFVAQTAYAFQESVVDVLVSKTVDAAQKHGATEILLAGGVAANTRLRAELRRRASVPVRYPPLSLCTDNAAMVAAAAFYRFEAGLHNGWDTDVLPGLRLGHN
jgi:N6-L-threonylcarbamoyladenine synthase